MNEYTVKSTSYAQIEAKDEESAIEEYKGYPSKYMYDDWEVEVIDDDENYDKDTGLVV